MTSFPLLVTPDLPMVHITSLDAKFRDSVFAMFYAKQSILDKYGGGPEEAEERPGQLSFPPLAPAIN